DRSLTFSASLPARLDHARHEAARSQFAQRDAGHFQLAIECARPARHFAAVANARRGGVAWEFRKLEGRIETLFGGERLVHRDLLQACARTGKLLHGLAALLVI